MQNLVIYSTGCPICQTLIKILTERNIDFTIVSDMDTILSIADLYGINEVPFAIIDGQCLDYKMILEKYSKEEC